MSRDYRAIDVKINMWRSSSHVPVHLPLFRVGLNMVNLPRHVELGFEHLQGQRLHNLSRQPVSLFDCPQCEKGYVKWDLLYFSKNAFCHVTEYNESRSIFFILLPCLHPQSGVYTHRKDFLALSALAKPSLLRAE